MTLIDMVTPTMTKINTSTVRYTRDLQNTRRISEKTWFGIRRGMLSVVGAAAALVGSVMALNKLEEAYKAQSQAEVKLQAVFKATGKATEEQVQNLKGYASAMQDLGVIGDEVTISGMQQLATFNVTSSTVETLTEGMLDLAAQTKGLSATQSDMVNIGNMIGKAMTGQVGALSRVGISFTEAQEKILKYGTEEERAATLAEVLKQNVGGVNAALANTPEGRMKQLSNTIGDMQEKFGAIVALVKDQFVSVLLEYMPQIHGAIDNVTAGIQRWVEEGGVQRFIDDIKLTIDTVKMLSPVILAVVSAILAYKASLLAATISQWSLNAAIMANPIGFAIGMVVALIGVVTLLRKNKDLLKLKWYETWNAIAGYGEGAVNKFLGFVNVILSAFSYLTSSIEFFFHNMWNKIVEMAEERISKLAAPINAVLSAFDKKTIDINFSSVKSKMEKPVWQQQDYFGKVEFKRFSDEEIGSLRDSIHNSRESKKIDEQLATNKAVIAALEENTSATNKNTSVMANGISRDMSAEEIADKLLPRLEREIYG